MTFHYTCPFCGRDTTITDANFSSGEHSFNAHNKYKEQLLRIAAVVCPNPQCKEYSLTVSLHDRHWQNQWHDMPAKKSWRLVPQSDARVMPDYVPAPVIGDYNEACMIKSLSPKASATLARRCLQGMIRDFWKVSKPRLIDEIEAIAEKVDPLTWDAIDGVRKIGNIGAHMERDINVIVDVEPEEAELLIRLIETLVQDWYVVRYEREQRLKKITQVSDNKTSQRQST